MFIITKDTKIFGLFSDSRNVDTLLALIVWALIIGFILWVII